MGRSDSSKPTSDRQPRQYFRGSHVSPRDKVGNRSVIRGGGPSTTLPSPTPINVAWRVMPSPHAAAAARPPYVSATSRGTTKIRLGVRTSSPLTGIKHTGLTGSPLPFPKRPVCGIVIPEMTRGTNRPTPRTWTTEEESTHDGGLDPHQRWRTCALGREQVEPTPQLDS
ncbi:hypothetical protein B296_00042434 [Ensete ventricosum]|uniref:Uncharacterized protein n=1 Tax=Ensete ventricosum TaxID=4639 RepID=A0A426XU10_ENSVE|nr:hypothetical protein B296_00042434 [Ensete ventricosum]